ncbi:MAG: peptidase S8, partial [Actinomycetales bacterium]
FCSAERTRLRAASSVDTGVAAHTDLGSNRLAGRDFVDPGTSATDPNGHGTHVAGIVAAIANNRRGVAGLAPHARILPVRVLGADGSGTTDVIARGVVYAADRGVQVINLSLAATQSDTALQRAVQYAQRKGVLVVAAAGNDGEGCFLFGCPTQYPAAYADVVGVGAVTSSLRRASFSSFGSWVDIAAPGDVILSTIPSTQRLGGDCNGRRYCALSGTSMATPYVAAAAALAYSEKGWRGNAISRRLFSTATDLGSSGRDDSFGHGLVNPSALTRAR